MRWPGGGWPSSSPISSRVSAPPPELAHHPPSDLPNLLLENLVPSQLLLLSPHARATYIIVVFRPSGCHRASRSSHSFRPSSLVSAFTSHPTHFNQSLNSTSLNSRCSHALQVHLHRRGLRRRGRRADGQARLHQDPRHCSGRRAHRDQVGRRRWQPRHHQPPQGRPRQPHDRCRADRYDFPLLPTRPPIAADHNLSQVAPPAPRSPGRRPPTCPTTATTRSPSRRASTP